MHELEVHIWSDIACPWCSIGKRRFEAALARFPERASVRVRWRSFELNPAAPVVEQLEGSYADRLARKYGVERARGEEMVAGMTAAAAAEGLEFRFDLVRPGNTFDAHRLLHFAAARGRGPETVERLLLAYMGEGQPMGDREVLARLAADVGLDQEEARGMLASEAFAREVRADEEEARARGIRGVPHFAIGPRHGLSGAQPPELLLRALQLAWDERASQQADIGPACGADGCA